MYVYVLDMLIEELWYYEIVYPWMTIYIYIYIYIYMYIYI